MNKNTYPASVIAYAFVIKGIEEGNPVTQMKLQKLVYFANGIYLAQGYGPLIKESFQSWEYGPVVPEIYS
ncbi:MAG: Panacea domain-containing protein, partial [Flavipsychrobacter sp.]